MTFRACRGTIDVPPESSRSWRELEAAAASLAQGYGYREIRTPTFEVADLFALAIGEDTEIIEKELYTFRDRAGRSLALRPEMTSSVLRALLEHKIVGPVSGLHKVYCIGPVFRYDRPPAGRFRQVQQFGVEAVGSLNPSLDAEIVEMAHRLVRLLEIKDTTLQLSTVGCDLCRPTYLEMLSDFLEGHAATLCEDCQRHLRASPMRVLDCTRDTCRDVMDLAPTIYLCLCPECRSHFYDLQEDLQTLGLDFSVNPSIVMGPNYYTKTIFEIGTPDAILCRGGRYDDLVAALGGPPTPAVGCAINLDRCLAAAEKLAAAEETTADVFLVSLGEEGDRAVLKALYHLRHRGVRAERDYVGRSLKSQLRQASRVGARYVVTVGDEELKSGSIPVKDTARGSQDFVPANRLGEALFQYLRHRSRAREPVGVG